MPLGLICPGITLFIKLSHLSEAFQALLEIFPAAGLRVGTVDRSTERRFNSASPFISRVLAVVPRLSNKLGHVNACDIFYVHLLSAKEK
jgi:hypothetical protein